MTAGPAAADLYAPILFTPTDQLHPSVNAWLADHAVRRVTVLGGTAAISEATAQAVDAPVRRVAGSSRDATAAAIVHQVLDDGSGRTRPVPFALVNLFDEQGWAYGLATAPVVGPIGGGILAVNPAADLAPTQHLVACARPAEVLVAGPESMISDQRVQGALTCPGDAGSAPSDPVALRGDGLGADIDFGLDADATVDRLSAIFGAPTSDSGRVQPACELAGPDGPAGRFVTFDGGLGVRFAEAVEDQLYFDGWVYEGTDLTTPEGVAVGDTTRVLEAAFGTDFILQEGDPDGGFPPPIGDISTPRGPLDAILTANDPNAQITELFGGNGLQFCE